MRRRLLSMQHCERDSVDERTRAREMMMQQQQRDDEAKNSSCLLVLSLVCERVLCRWASSPPFASTRLDSFIFYL